MLTNSRDIIRRLDREGWTTQSGRGKGSHHVLKSPDGRQTVTVPPPKKDLGKGLVHAIYKDAGWEPD